MIDDQTHALAKELVDIVHKEIEQKKEIAP